MINGETRSLTSGMLLPELISTRGLAAVWVVIVHTIATVIQGHTAAPFAFEYSRILVDFFFVLSGFVLAHMYDPPWREGRFRHGSFLVRRLARLWPLHMATLLVFLAMLLAARLFGVAPDYPHTPSSFIVTAAMLHSTWLTPSPSWNWPSWSISAEWCAYLTIPLYFMIADRVRGTLLRLGVGLAAFVAAALFSHAVFELDLVDLTFDGGAFRIIPSMFMGILLRRIFDDEPSVLAMTPAIYAAILGGVTAVCAALIWLRAPYDVLWPPMVLLVAALASRATWTTPGVLRWKPLIWLGDLSYSIYMTHAIVLGVVFTGAAKLGLAETLTQRSLLGLSIPFLTLALSQITYVLVEKPGRGVVMRLFEGRKDAASARTPVKAG